MLWRSIAGSGLAGGLAIGCMMLVDGLGGFLPTTAARAQGSSVEDDPLDIGLLDATPETQSFSGFVGTGERDDYYRFELQTHSTFTLRLEGMTANADVFLGNEQGQSIAQSRNNGIAPETLSLPLDPGAYYILVRSRNGGNTNYTLKVSGEFIPQETIVSNPQVPLRDPEFDQMEFQVTWVDDQERLRVAPINPNTGALLLDQTVEVDRGLAPLDCSNKVPLGLCNGPEWAYSQEGSQVVYTKVINNQWFLARAKKVAGQWLPEVLEKSRLGHAPFGSLTPGDDRPRIKFSYGPEYATQEPTVWRELDNASTTNVVAPGLQTEGGRWIEGERALILTIVVDGTPQVATYDIDTGTLTQLTSSPPIKGETFMWRAPEYNNELLFSVIETDTENLENLSTIGIYRNIGGTWTKIKTITPPTNKLFLNSAEPFVYDGKSYISMLAVRGPFGIPDRLKGAEVWIAGIDPDLDFYRQVSNPANPLKRDDPEPFVGNTGAVVYYADVSDGKSIIYRADTGLRPQVPTDK